MMITEGKKQKRMLPISGDTAGTKDIHCLVASHLKINLAKRNWKKAYNATTVIRQLQMLRLSSQAASTSTND
ncbi:unnamed protein product [Onchocerca flexuosa]|uniref:Transposase n=1 Tax=Onchocerca flexuosa TaxID=387005 RepID=A0A183H654_9BILA|nr:unnamed protein product [Onchocerca flexuosa]